MPSGVFDKDLNNRLVKISPVVRGNRSPLMKLSLVMYLLFLQTFAPEAFKVSVCVGKTKKGAHAVVKRLEMCVRASPFPKHIRLNYDVTKMGSLLLTPRLQNHTADRLKRAH